MKNILSQASPSPGLKHKMGQMQWRRILVEEVDSQARLAEAGPRDAVPSAPTTAAPA